MNKQRVTVRESYIIAGSKYFLDTYREVRDLSVRAAWSFYEFDLLHHRDCSKTEVMRYGVNGRGAIYHIRHISNSLTEAGNLCKECLSLKIAEVSD